MGRQGSGEVGHSLLISSRYHPLTGSRLRDAKILLITVRALANEVAKNLVLAGIGSLTIQDENQIIENDLGAQFFVSEEDIGKNVRGRAL